MHCITPNTTTGASQYASLVGGVGKYIRTNTQRSAMFPSVRDPLLWKAVLIPVRLAIKPSKHREDFPNTKGWSIQLLEMKSGNKLHKAIILTGRTRVTARSGVETRSNL